jgi:hypothetical protein
LCGVALGGRAGTRTITLTAEAFFNVVIARRAYITGKRELFALRRRKRYLPYDPGRVSILVRAWKVCDLSSCTHLLVLV